MEKLGIKNLRSIKQYNEVTLKPITILLGKNSSGKSTFLRSLPLLKQTIEESTSEPILWYGNQVDFGSFEESKSKNSGDTIDFSYFIKTNLKNVKRFRYSRNVFHLNEYDINPMEITRINICNSEEYIRKIILDYYDNELLIQFDSCNNVETIEINGINILNKNEHFICVKSNNLIIPRIYFSEFNLKNDSNKSIEDYYRDILIKYLKKLSRSDTSESTIIDVLDNLGFSSRKSIQEKVSNLKSPVQLQKKLSELFLMDSEFNNFYGLYTLMYLNPLLDYLNSCLIFEANSINYSQPLRAQVDRYYRIRGISTDTVDSNGFNLPMIISKFSNSEKTSFEKFTAEYLNCIFSVNNQAGHISLFVKELNSNEIFNVADVGFGYSQVLPILMSIWNGIYNKNKFKRLINRRYDYFIGRSKTFIQAIEQLELHLHPAFQAKIIDLFCSLIMNTELIKDNDIKFIIETHSESIINRLGYLINKNILDKNLVNIVIFSKNNDGTTSINETNFDERGILNNWPIGFFVPEGINNVNKTKR